MVNTFNATVVFFIAFLSFLTVKWIRFYGYFSPGRVTNHINTSYDYIVVGGGSTGAVVAARLSENPNITVLLLEAGGEETDSPTFHIPGFMFEHSFTDIDWMYQIDKQKHSHPNRQSGNEEFWGAGRVLGGSSIINYLQYARGSRHDFDSWQKEGCTGWSYEEVLPFYRKSEDILVPELKNSVYHGSGGFLGVTDSRDHPLYDDFLASGQQLGYDVIDHNGEFEIGFSPHYWNAKNGVRSSPARDLLRGAMARDNLHVSVRSFVTKVLLTKNQAVGVEFIKDGRKRSIKVKREVILSAGAYGSPRILLLSGIGPPHDLEQLNIPVVADLPVGQNLRYHYIMPFWIDTNSSHLEAKMPTITDFLQYLAFDSGPLASQVNAGVAFLRSGGQTDGRPDFELQFLSGKFPTAASGLAELDYINNHSAFSFVLMLLHPKSTGFMTLKTPDPFDPPLFNPLYFSNESDMKEIIKGIRIIQKYIKTPSMQKHKISLGLSKIPPCEHEVFDSDKYWDCYVRNVVIGGHQTTTCKMGDVKNDDTVVSPELKVKGIKGLRVMDASVFPTAISGNTNAPCIMVGEKGADMVLRELYKSS